MGGSGKPLLSVCCGSPCEEATSSDLQTGLWLLRQLYRLLFLPDPAQVPDKSFKSEGDSTSQISTHIDSKIQGL